MVCFEIVVLLGQVVEGEVIFVQFVIDVMMCIVDVCIVLFNFVGDLWFGLYGMVVLEELGVGLVLIVLCLAVFDSGMCQVVLVEIGFGCFVLCDVSLGWCGGDCIEIFDGLIEGEQVVVFVNFLIDVESNLQLVFQGFEGYIGYGVFLGIVEDLYVGYGEDVVDLYVGYGDEVFDLYVGYFMLVILEEILFVFIGYEGY